MNDGQNEPSRTQRQADGIAVLDAKGLYCPEPVMLLHNKVGICLEEACSG